MTRLAKLLYLCLAKGGGWIPFAMLLITIPITVVCVFHLVAGYSFVGKNPKTEGVIERFDCPKRASGCFAVISFVVDGAKRELTVRENPAPSFRSGQVVSVAYQIDSSSNVSAKLIESPVHVGFLVALAFVTLMQAFLLFAIYNTFSIFRSSSYAKRLLRQQRIIGPSPRQTR